MHPMEWGFAVQDALRLINGETVFLGRRRLAGIKPSSGQGQPRQKTNVPGTGWHAVTRPWSHVSSHKLGQCVCVASARGPRVLRVAEFHPTPCFQGVGVEQGAGVTANADRPLGSGGHPDRHRQNVRGSERRVKDKRESGKHSSGLKSRKGLSCGHGTR